MATIINNLQNVFSTDAQQAINNAAANLGVDTVYTAKNSGDGNKDVLFDFYSEEEYLFSLDIEGVEPVIFDKR